MQGLLPSGWLLFALAAVTASAQAPSADKGPLKERIRSGEVVVGSFNEVLVSGPAVQFLAGQGLDFFFLDIEHYTFDQSRVREVIAAARGAGIAPIVRVGEPNQEIARWLDAGAAGIIIPDVEAAAEAEALVRYGRYPPEGQRRVSSTQEHSDSGLAADAGAWLAKENREILLLVMIETPRGFENLEEILSVPGIDGAIMGTGDFTNAIGLPGQMDHPRAWAAAERLVSYCQEKNLIVTVPIRTPENIRHWMERGVNVIAFVSRSLVRDGIQLYQAEVRRVADISP